jgi:hypothetical protein
MDISLLKGKFSQRYDFLIPEYFCEKLFRCQLSPVLCVLITKRQRNENRQMGLHHDCFADQPPGCLWKCLGHQPYVNTLDGEKGCWYSAGGTSVGAGGSFCDSAGRGFENGAGAGRSAGGKYVEFGRH